MYVRIRMYVRMYLDYLWEQMEYLLVHLTNQEYKLLTTKSTRSTRRCSNAKKTLNMYYVCSMHVCMFDTYVCVYVFVYVCKACSPSSFFSRVTIFDKL